uniref:Regulatory-associated protein of mTOR n=1 Tax=Schistosoma haematobium TaxID=6185 RepID=A0A095CGE1_SCHHA
MLHFIAFQNFDFTDCFYIYSLFVFLITSLLVIVKKAEFQAICYNSPNNNDNNDKFITNEDTTLISSLNTSFTSSNTSNDNASNTVNELNSTPDNNNSSRFSENASIKELNSNTITSITTNSALQMTTTNPSSSSLIHSAQFPGRRHQQTDQRLRVSVTNSPQSPNTIISNNTLTDYEPVSLGTISIDPKAVAYTDRVNRLKKQRKISHLGRLQWERVAGQISHPIVTSNSNVNTTTTTISRNISFCNSTPITTTTNNISSSVGMSNMSRSRISLRSNDSGDNNINNSLDDYYLHPIAFYNHHLNHGNNNNNDNYCSISSQMKFHPYQSHLVMINSERKGVTIHSTKNLKLLHSINTFTTKSSLFPDFPSTIDGYSRVGYVTDIEFINADEEESLLLTATDDGYIRIWRNYTHHLGQDPEILTAWNGITDLYQTDYPVGVVVHWSQQANQLIVSGDTRIIRIWDCLCESRLRDINTGSDTSVTCLTKSIDNHLLAAGFNDGADTARIFKVVFSSTNRLYAVGAMGGIGAWHLSFPTENNNTTPTTITSNTPLLSNSLNSNNNNNGDSICHDHINLSNHPRRYISTVVRSSTNNTINNSSTTRRFRRLPCPPRLSLPMNSSVNCADLLVNLSSPHAHLALAGIRGQSSISLHRIQDGSLHSSIRNFNITNNNNFGREQFGTPICCAFHPNEPLIAAGFHDRTLVLLNVQNKSINKEV